MRLDDAPSVFVIICLMLLCSGTGTPACAAPPGVAVPLYRNDLPNAPLVACAGVEPALTD